VENKPDEAVTSAIALDSFLNYAFHEISSPLTVLYSYAQLVLDSLPDEANLEPTRRYLNKIVQQGDRTVEMLAEFLEATRLLAETMRLDKLEMPPLKLLEQIVEERWMAEFKPVALQLDAGGAKTSLAIDAPRIKQSFEHILDFIAGSQTLGGAEDGKKILAIVRAEINTVYSISFIAPGLVLSENQQANLFAFYRPVESANHSSAVHPKGSKTGMGLYIAHGVIKLHGGDLQYSSDLPGFKLSLPLDKS
jgi:signal transduction histidine kinase